MLKSIGTGLLALMLVLGFHSVRASGPTMHIEIGHWGIQGVEDPGLKQMLTDQQRKHYGMGLLLPDSLVMRPIGDIGPAPMLKHTIGEGGNIVSHEATILSNYLAYITRPVDSPIDGGGCGTNRDDLLTERLGRGCTAQLAHFFGTLGHVVGDFHFDRYFLTEVDTRCAFHDNGSSEVTDNDRCNDAGSQGYTDRFLDGYCSRPPGLSGTHEGPNPACSSLTDRRPECEVGPDGQGCLKAYIPQEEVWFVLKNTFVDVPCTKNSDCEGRRCIDGFCTSYSSTDVQQSITSHYRFMIRQDNFNEQVKACCPWAVENWENGPGGSRDSGARLADYINKTWETLMSAGSEAARQDLFDRLASRQRADDRFRSGETRLPWKRASDPSPRSSQSAQYDADTTPDSRPGYEDRDKATICHVPPGNPDNAHTISVSQNAVPAHLGHGDTLGPCANGETPTATFPGFEHPRTTSGGLCDGFPREIVHLGSGSKDPNYPELFYAPGDHHNNPPWNDAEHLDNGYTFVGDLGRFDFSSWIAVKDGVSKFEMTEDGILAVVDGRLEGHSGYTFHDMRNNFSPPSTSGPWTEVAGVPGQGAVVDFQLEEWDGVSGAGLTQRKSRLGVLLNDGTLHIGETPGFAGTRSWTQVADDVLDFELAADRIAVRVGKAGRELLVHEGSLEHEGAAWVRVAKAWIMDFQLEPLRTIWQNPDPPYQTLTVEEGSGRIGVLVGKSTGRQLLVKDGPVGADWTRLDESDAVRRRMDRFGISQFELVGGCLDTNPIGCEVRVLVGREFLVQTGSLENPSWKTDWEWTFPATLFHVDEGLVGVVKNGEVWSERPGAASEAKLGGTDVLDFEIDWAQSRFGHNRKVAILEKDGTFRAGAPCFGAIPDKREIHHFEFSPNGTYDPTSEPRTDKWIGVLVGDRMWVSSVRRNCAKRIVGEKCSTDTDCCSDDCVERNCRTFGVRCKLSGVCSNEDERTCTQDSDCYKCSGKDFGRCPGGTDAECRFCAQPCARPGQPCSINAGCCSNDCRGTGENAVCCKELGQSCTANRFCCSRTCTNANVCGL